MLHVSIMKLLRLLIRINLLNDVVSEIIDMHVQSNHKYVNKIGREKVF